MKEALSQKNIPYMYFDISLDFGALKRFLKLRDTNPIFEPVKEAGRVGIPTLIIDQEVMLGYDEEKVARLLAE